MGLFVQVEATHADSHTLEVKRPYLCDNNIKQSSFGKALFSFEVHGLYINFGFSILRILSFKFR